jgi:6-phosphofructokinase 2
MSNGPCEDIAVLALNPTVDVNYEIPQLIAGKKVQATRTRYDPGGNGVNVARALKELGQCSHCCCIVAGEIGGFLLGLMEQRLSDVQYYRVEGETRINVTLSQNNPPEQFEIDAPGPEVTASALQEISDCFLDCCKGGFGVLTGSIPPGVPLDVYGRLSARIREQGGRAVVDAHGERLTHALREHPFLIKLNRYEAEMLTGRQLATVADVAWEGRQLQRQGVDYVCISLAGEGAVLVDAKDSFYCPSPAIHVRSTVGAGDAMVAGLTVGFQRGDEVSEVLRLGVACGAGAAAHSGTGLFTHDQVQELATGLEVQALGI